MRKNSKKLLTLALGAALFSAAGIAISVGDPAKASADSAITFATVGAQVRNEGVAGIRFVTVVSNEAYDEKAQYGTLIIPKNVLADGKLTLETQSVLNISAEKWNHSVLEKTEYATGYRAYTGVVVGETLETAFPAEEYGRNFVACGYATDSEGNTTYTEPVVRSMAYVASEALADPDADHTALLTNIVDTVAEGFHLEESALTLDLGETEMLSVNGTNGLTPIYTVSDSATVWVGESGEVQGLKNGTATVTATLGSQQAEVNVTVESQASSLGTSGSIANGVVKLHGTTRTSLPYIVLTDCEIGDTIEAEFTGKNTPVIRFMGEVIDGNIKNQSNTGMLIDNSTSVFRIYSKYSEASDATVLDPNYENGKLDQDTTYVLRAWLKTDLAKQSTVSVQFYSKSKDGTLTLLTNGSKTMTAANIGLTEGNPNYVMLYGNAKSGGTTSFRYRVYKSGEAVDFYTTDSNVRPSSYDSATGTLRVFQNANRENACYVAFETGIDEYFEYKWTNNESNAPVMPVIRLGTTVITANTKDGTGGGYTISNSANSSFRVYTGGDTGTTLKTMGSDLVDGTTYVLRAGVENRGGVLYLHVDLYTDVDGVLTNVFTLGEDQQATNITADDGLYLIFYGNNGKNKGSTGTYTTYKLNTKEVENVTFDKTTGVVSFAKSAVSTEYQISVNGGAWANVTSDGYTANYTVDGISDGVYNVVIRSSDGKEVTAKTYTVSSDDSVAD